MNEHDRSVVCRYLWHIVTPWFASLVVFVMNQVHPRWLASAMVSESTSDVNVA